MNVRKSVCKFPEKGIECQSLPDALTEEVQTNEKEEGSTQEV